MNPMNTAPRDGTWVLAELADEYRVDGGKPFKLVKWAVIPFRPWRWAVWVEDDGPVSGGYTDDWFKGWLPLPSGDGWTPIEDGEPEYWQEVDLWAEPTASNLPPRRIAGRRWVRDAYRPTFTFSDCEYRVVAWRLPPPPPLPALPEDGA